MPLFANRVFVMGSHKLSSLARALLPASLSAFPGAHYYF